MIIGDAISLRPFDRAHFEKTREWANDPELIRLLDRARPVSDVEHERWFAAVHERSDCVYFAIETNHDKRHVGNVWLSGIDWRHRKAEVRIVIGDTNTLGRGLGSEAIDLISVYAFDRLNLHKVYAYVLATNPRAQRAFEKAGFVMEGILRNDRWTGNQYSDVYVLGKLSSNSE